MSENEQTRVDLDPSTQVGETSYQVITPGYQATGEQAPERDTHFAGYAKLLWDELLHVNEFGYIEISDDEEEENKRYAQIIAQRAYDLVKHVIENTKSGTLETAHFYFDESVSDIPDMTAWPEQSE